MTQEFNPRISLRLSVQRALIGAVTANLAAVTAGLEGRGVRLIAYFFEQPTEEETENFEVAASEVIADFPEGYMVETSSLTLRSNVAKMLDFWAIARLGVGLS